jgi:hypothetical protein
LLYQAKGTYLIPSDSTANRTFSNLKYQAIGTYLIPSDSTANRTFSNLKYQAKATYLIPSDSTNARAYSDARYAYKGLYGTATITNDSVITVTHGYGSTPPVVMLTMNNNSLGVIPYVDALGATTFRIHFCIVGNYTVYWFIPKN